MRQRHVKPMHYLLKTEATPCARIVCGSGVSYGKYGPSLKFTTDVERVSCVRCARRCDAITDEQRKTIRTNARWRLTTRSEA